MCYYGKDQIMNAVVCLRKALYFDPLQEKIQFNMGLVMYAAQLYMSAFHHFSASIQLSPN